MSRTSLTPEQGLVLLAEVPRRISALTRGVSEAQLHRAPERGEWSANEVLAHLRACADTRGEAFRTILASDHPTIRAINPLTWIKETDYLDLDFRASLRAFTKQRAALLRILEPLPPKGWSRAATVTGAGRPLERSVLDYAGWVAVHERPHLKQFAALAKRFPARRNSCAVAGSATWGLMAQRRRLPTICFDASLYSIDRSTLLRLPEKASRKLPSRGQVAVQGTIDGHEFRTVLEPDGSFGHWMRVDRKLQRSASLSLGDTATLEIEPVKEWPEPSVPQDLKKALAAAPQKIQDVWKEITPMSRWEWVRWVNATRDPNTRKRRVDVSISKMKSGKRRPCCFNLAACTDPDLSRNGRLLTSPE